MRPRSSRRPGPWATDRATKQGLALRLPSDGVHSLRLLLDRLDEASIEVDGLSVSSADLDDVFLSLTGRRDGQEVGTP